MENIRNAETPETPRQDRTAEAIAPDKAAYMERILALDAEGQAFIDGFLFAKLTAAAKPA